MEALYRKYRPTTFADVVGQEHIERTLKNAIEQNKVSHAYLFCGPRGTGKTTMARILAKALLCEQGPTTNPDGTCPECEAIAQGIHPDVYELDAASRTGVENVREEIISRVNYAPTRGTWKVYIIDEVHMLSTAAFNALLKTLEEPPAHVVFILCTTDPQKVPDTIHSRCQRFDFHRISAESIVSRLGAICVEEGVDFEGEALDLIAYRAEGGMRNALTSLEQLMAFGGGHVTLEGAQNLLGSLDDTDISEIVLAIGRRNAAACFNWIARYVETGADLAQFVRDLAEYIRNLYLLSMAGLEVEIPVSEATRTSMVDQLQWFGEDRLSRLLLVLGDLMKELRVSSNPRLSFEIALTRMIRPDSDMTIEALAERVEALEAAMSAGSRSVAPAAASSIPAASPSVTPVASSIPAASPSVTPVASSIPAASPGVTPVASSITSPSVPVVSPSVSSAAVPSGASSMAPSVASEGLSAPAAFQSVAPTVSPSLVDLTNPAALQRLWHATTSLLRKKNPARGVLFMNAKVSAEPHGQGIVVEFSRENTFAYNAAQKKEVRTLLEETLQETAGGTVPYRLAIAGGDAKITPSTPPSYNTPSSMSPAARSVNPSVPSPAQSVSDAANNPVTKKDNHMSDGARVADNAYTPAAYTPVGNAPVGDAYASADHAPAIDRVSDSGSVSDSSRISSGNRAPDDDQVPLDVYDEMASASYESFSSSAVSPDFESGFPLSAPSQEASPAFSSAVPQKAPSAFPPVAPQQPPANPASASSSSDPASVAGSEEFVATNEADRIKSILTATFGQGVKFDELPE